MICVCDPGVSIPERVLFLHEMVLISLHPVSMVSTRVSMTLINSTFICPVTKNQSETFSRGSRKLIKNWPNTHLISQKQKFKNANHQKTQICKVKNASYWENNTNPEVSCAPWASLDISLNRIVETPIVAFSSLSNNINCLQESQCCSAFVTLEVHSFAKFPVSVCLIKLAWELSKRQMTKN